MCPRGGCTYYRNVFDPFLCCEHGELVYMHLVYTSYEKTLFV